MVLRSWLLPFQRHIPHCRDPSNPCGNIFGLDDSLNDTLLVVKGISPNWCISYFEVLDNNRLQPHAFDCNYLQQVRNAPVRVVAKMGKKGMLHHSPSITHMCDRMWLYAKEPVARLLWDPKGWFWSYSLGEQFVKVPFFQYSVKLGRSLLMSTNATVPTTQKHWTNFAIENLLKMDMVFQRAH